MISLDDIKDLFINLSREFKLIINDDIIMCNKQILTSYSQIVNSLSPEVMEFSMKTPIDPKYFRDINEFLHGSSCNFAESAFEYLCVAAFLDISILQPRLFEFVENGTNENNFEERYLLLNQYVDYCIPFSSFLDKNPAFFKQFIQSHVLAVKFARCLFEHTKSIFPTEDEKLSFLFSLIDKSEIELTDKDYSIFELINPMNLSERSIFDLITHKNAPLYAKYLNSIQLFDRQLSIHNEYLKKLHSIETKQAELQETYDNLSQQHIDALNEFDSLNAQCFLHECKRSAFQRTVHEISRNINTIIGFLETLNINNNQYIQFSKQIGSMHSLAHTLTDLLDSFYKQIGSVIYPGSSRDAAKYSREWMNVASDLFTQTQKITYDANQGKKYLEILKNASSFFETLVPISDPPMKAGQLKRPPKS